MTFNYRRKLMSNYAFTSPEKFKELTFLISEITNTKVSKIRHEIAKKEGFNSVEAYLKMAFQNFEKYNDFDNVFSYKKNNEIIIVFNAIGKEKYEKSSEISKFISGSENYIEEACQHRIDEGFLNQGIIKYSSKNEELLKDTLKYYYKNFNSPQKYVFDLIYDKALDELKMIAEEIIFFLEDNEGFEFERTEDFSFPAEINEDLKKGLPSMLFKYYDNDLKNKLFNDDDFTTIDITNEAVYETYQETLEKIIKLLCDHIYLIADLEQKTYGKKVDNEHLLKIIEKYKDRNVYKEKMFFNYIITY